MDLWLEVHKSNELLNVTRLIYRLQTLLRFTFTIGIGSMSLLKVRERKCPYRSIKGTTLMQM